VSVSRLYMIIPTTLTVALRSHCIIHFVGEVGQPEAGERNRRFRQLVLCLIEKSEALNYHLMDYD
jgi:hypothetical protein